MSKFAGYYLVEDILANWQTTTPRPVSVVVEDNGSWHNRDKRDLQSEADESGIKLTWAFLDA
jgi:hypothetical protein